MSIISTKKRRGITFVELLVLLVISGVICSAVGYILYNEAVRLDALETENQIKRTANAAYDISIGLEKSGELEAPTDLYGCSIMKMEGAWYLVCNLNEITGGSKAEERIILQDFMKKYEGQGLTPSYDGENSIALFLRFASDKSSPIPEHSGGFVKLLQDSNSSEL